ncbi:hypothetical protein Pelo_2850 [Pelomyxa schiedti]|nr:hypothetical protein Pelo_2850 [Pelomyxa schiedti]
MVARLVACALICMFIGRALSSSAFFTANECSAKYKGVTNELIDFFKWGYQGVEVVYEFEDSGANFTAILSLCSSVYVVEGAVASEAQDTSFDRSQWEGIFFGYPGDMQSAVSLDVEDLATISTFTAPFEGGDSGYPCGTPRTATTEILCNQHCPGMIEETCQIGTSSLCICSVEWPNDCSFILTVAMNCEEPEEIVYENEEAARIAGIVMLSVVFLCIATLALFEPVGKIILHYTENQKL